MNSQYYRELDPEKRWQILQREPDSEEKRRAEELYLVRHRDKKTGERNTEQDHYLWFLITLSISGSKRPLFTRSEARKVLRELQTLGSRDGETDLNVLKDDLLFRKELENTAARFFYVSTHDGGGRKLFGIGRSGEDLRISDQCVDAWRLIYGAPEYLNLKEELRMVSEAVRKAYYAVDSEAEERLAALDRKKRPGQK